MKSKYISIFWILFLLLPLATLKIASESLEEQEKPFATGKIEKVKVFLVQLEFIAVDSKGRHIKGLHKDDFQIFEDGKIQEIKTFDEIDLSNRWNIKEDSIKVASRTMDVQEKIISKEGLERNRIFLFLFDGYHYPSPLRLNQAKRAAIRFIEEKFRSGDQGAVFEMVPHVRMLCNFSEDRNQLIEAIEEVSYLPGNNMGDELIENIALTATGQRQEDLEARLRQASHLRNIIMSYERENYYDVLSTFSYGLLGLKGRKIILLFSGGYPITIPNDRFDNRGGITQGFREMIENISKSQVSIYCFNIGEQSYTFDASKSVDYRKALERLGFNQNFFEDIGIDSSFWKNSILARQQILAVLANESGGRFMAGADYGRALEDLDDDTSHYYLIGYSPEGDETDEIARYKKIEIRVNKKNAKVLCRKGRFAGRPHHELIQKTKNETKFIAVKQKPNFLSTSAENEEKEKIPLDVIIQFYPYHDKTRAVFLIQTRSPIQPFKISHKEWLLDLSLKISAIAGDFEVQSMHKDIKLNINEKGWKELKKGFRIVEFMDLKSGFYTFKAVLNINGLNMRGEWIRAAEAKNYLEKDLQLSTLSFLDDSPPPLIYDAFLKDSEEKNDGKDLLRLDNDWRMLPYVEKIFHPQDEILTFFKVWNLKEIKAHQKYDLKVSCQIFSKEDRKEYQLPANLLYFKETLENENTFNGVIAAKLPEIHQGEYYFMVTINDIKNGRTARSSSIIHIDEGLN